MAILAGEFITAADQTITTYEGVASGNLALVAGIADVPGATVTVTAQTNSAVYIATVTCRLDKTAASTSAAIAIPRLNVDGSTVGQVPWSNAASGGLAMVSRTFRGSLTAGSHTFKITGSCSTAVIWTVSSGDTNIVVTVIA